jgi:hypothetical protein
MIRLRRRLRVRIALVAIAALLWSQIVLATHADCLQMPTAAAPVAALDVDHGCEGPMPSSQQPVCAVHCSHGDVSADSARIPPVPPMLSAPGTPWSSLAVLANRVDVSVLPRIASSPPVSWHRPTTHPAALLLI